MLLCVIMVFAGCCMIQEFSTDGRGAQNIKAPEGWGSAGLGSTRAGGRGVRVEPRWLRERGVRRRLGARGGDRVAVRRENRRRLVVAAPTFHLGSSDDRRGAN